MSEILYLNTVREGYGIDQIRYTMTVGELISYLEQYDEDTQVYLKHDGGYTYGAVIPCRFEEDVLEEEDEEEFD